MSTQRPTLPPSPAHEPPRGWANPAALERLKAAADREQAEALARLVLAGQGTSPAAIALAARIRGAR